MVFKIYRVYEFITHVVWSKAMPEDWENMLDCGCFRCLDVSTGLTNLPYVYTKLASPDVAADLASIVRPKGTRPDIYEEITHIVEAYPHSYHHAPDQEIGIGFGVGDNRFDVWPSWKYYKVHGPQVPLQLVTMTDDTVAQRRWNKKRRPIGFPEDAWKLLKRLK